MTEKEKREYKEMLGDDLMEMVFDMGFEEWYDENAETLTKQWEKETKEVKPDSKTGDSELDAILDVIERICDEPEDDKEENNEIYDAARYALARLSNDVFKAEGTLPEGTWDSIKGAINPKLPDDGSMFMFSVCCEKDDVYIISQDGYRKFDVYKDGRMASPPTSDDLVKALSVLVYKGLTSIIDE